MKIECDNKSLIDIKTGEIIENVKTIITHKQSEYLDKKSRMSVDNKEFVNEYGNFIFKTQSKSVTKLEDKISNSDMARLIYIATYLDYNNILKTDDGQVITKSILKIIVSVDDKIFYKWYNDLVKRKVIIEDENFIKINKQYCLKGEISKNKEYNRIFINSIRHIYENNSNKNMATLGHILRILPFVNCYNNILSWNPKEYNPEKVNPITIGELLIQLDEYNGSIKKFKNTISKYRMDNGEPVIIFCNDEYDSSKEIIMFNPRLTYSGKNEDLPKTYELFMILGSRYNQFHKNDAKIGSNKAVAMD